MSKRSESVCESKIAKLEVWRHAWMKSRLKSTAGSPSIVGRGDEWER